jgi:Cu-Zn family superoxide dismutase
MKNLFLALLLVLGVGIVRADDTTKIAASPLMAMCSLSPASNSQVKGWVKFTQMKGYVKIEGEIMGLTPGKHGFHVHEKGDCSSPDATSAGGHFNPTNKDHGSPSSKDRHVGDLGNITANKNGVAKISFKDNVIRLSGENSILDRSLIVHGDRDDLKSQPTGNAGKRVACGVIELHK